MHILLCSILIQCVCNKINLLPFGHEAQGTLRLAVMPNAYGQVTCLPHNYRNDELLDREDIVMCI